MRRNLEDAHIPTWLKIKLMQVARREEPSYKAVGWHLGYYHGEDFNLNEEEVDKAKTVKDFPRPTETLRKIFALEDHPRAEFVNLIPAKRWRGFLDGLLFGLARYTYQEMKEP